MKWTKSHVILNKTDVDNVINRLGTISSDILKMKDSLAQNKNIGMPEFQNSFHSAISEANRIILIKDTLTKVGKNL